MIALPRIHPLPQSASIEEFESVLVLTEQPEQQ